MIQTGRRVHLRLPATSANLGPAFDAAAVALNLYLEIEAEAAETFSISAQGRDALICGKLEGNLILDTYRQIMRENGRSIRPLSLSIHNAIPLGMGCGSSAAARLAGIVLAVEFGELDWPQAEILAAATHLEGHPDNVTACWLGGMTVSAISPQADDTLANSRVFPRVHVARFDVPQHWSAVILLPRQPVRTEASREMLPSHFSRSDVVENLQRCSLLVAAFASGSGDLLRVGMSDRLHQPYRSAICPLLHQLPLITEIPGVLGAALSGAGPGMLLVLAGDTDSASLERSLQKVLPDPASIEILQCGFAAAGAGTMESGSGNAN